MDRIRTLAKGVWPVLRLRSLFFGTLLFVAALPGFAALGLRVYENALVRRTEAELAAQAAAISATAALLWPGTQATDTVRAVDRDGYSAPLSEIDLRTASILPPRPAPLSRGRPVDGDARAVASRLTPVIAETARTTLAGILLLDRHGTLLNGTAAGASFADIPEVRAGLAGQTATILRRNEAYGQPGPLDWVSRATAIRLHHVRPIMVAGRVQGVVLVSRSPAALFRGMWEDAGKIAAGTAAIFLLLILLSAVLAKAIVRPIEKLSEAARALASGRQAEPVRPTLEVSEIRSLYDDFTVMAASIAKRSRYLRDFAAALSHEFKTPLAALQGGIELLQDHGKTMSEHERERFLANMRDDAERLSRLVSRLMALAQADMRAGEVFQPANPHAILARLADAENTPGFCVELAAGPTLALLDIEEAALETVLATIIENARQAGASLLRIETAIDGNTSRIDLVDDGPGIVPADRERIFEPFFTSRREHGGTGLGLPIAQALVANRGGSLMLVDSGEGARFSLRLPLHEPSV